MANLTFVDYLHDGTEYDVQFGTCDYCFSTGMIEHSNPRFIFRDADGDDLIVDGSLWKWGDYFAVEIENVVDFGAWLADQDVSNDLVDRLRGNDFYALKALTNDYIYG